MKKIISISTDRNIFKEGSAVQARQREYGGLFDELHIIIFTKRSMSLPQQIQIGQNVWVYSTHSLSKLFYIRDAVRIAEKIVGTKKTVPQNMVVTTQDPFETGIAGIKIKKKFGVPLHVQIHTDFLSPFFAKQSLLNRVRVLIAQKILPHADAVRVVSKKIADSMKREQNGIFLKNGVVPHVLPIFIGTEKIASIDDSIRVSTQNDLKKKYPQFDQIILVASRLTKEKNIPLALRVFARVLKAHPRAGLVVVGAGPEEKPLRRLAKRLIGPQNGQKIPQNVIFEPWKHDLSNYYKSADLFLLTSNFEGYGLTLVEAISAGCAVVSTDVGIARELLGENAVPFQKTEKETEVHFLRQTLKVLESSDFREKSIRDACERLPQVAMVDKKSYLDRYKQSYE